MKLWFATVLFGSCTLACSSGNAQHHQHVDLTGQWQGILHGANGDRRAVLTVTPDDGRNDGVLSLVDFPGFAIGLSGFDALRVDGSLVESFMRDNPDNGYDGYRGHLSPDGNTMHGAWVHNLKEWPLDLKRVTGSPEAWPVREPTVDDMRRTMDSAARRTSLIAAGSAPFHLVAAMEFIGSPGSAANGTFDELWRDPLHWRLSFTSGSSVYTEVVNGPHAYRTGQLASFAVDPRRPADGEASLARLLERLEQALLNPLRPELLQSRTLDEAGGLARDNNILLDTSCFHVEPRLPNIPADLPVATSSFCFSFYDQLPREATYPGERGDLQWGDGDSWADFVPFGAKQVARSVDIEISKPALRAHLRVTTLSPASDFRAITAGIPPGAEPIAPHRQDDPVAGELMVGQELSGSQETQAMFEGKGLGPKVPARFRLHLDPLGTVTSVDVLSDVSHWLNPDNTPTVMRSLKRYRYKASYREGHAVPTERIVQIGTDPGSYD